MARFAQVRVEWDGSSRDKPAKLRLETRSGAEFDEAYGVGYVVRPGGGTTGNDAERLKSIELAKDHIEINWHATGGQNYTIQVKFKADDKVEFGPFIDGVIRVVAAGVVNNETDHLP